MLETAEPEVTLHDGDVSICPRFRLSSREDLDAILLARKAADVVTTSRASFSHTSVQSSQKYKETNEDRVFVHKFTDGVLFGVLDGEPARIIPVRAHESMAQRS